MNHPTRLALIAILGAAVFSACMAAQAAKPMAMESEHSAQAAQGFSAMPAQAHMLDGQLHAKVEGRAATDCSKAWQVFTDFEKMPSFLPGIESSKVKARAGNHATIVQEGSHRFGIFAKRYKSERMLTMIEPSSIDSRSAPSDEIATASTTTFTPAPAGCSIVYSTTIATPDWIPASTAVGAAKSMAHAQMGAMIAEVKRRFGPASDSMGPAPLLGAAKEPSPLGAPAEPRPSLETHSAQEPRAPN